MSSKEIKKALRESGLIIPAGGVGLTTPMMSTCTWNCKEKCSDTCSDKCSDGCASTSKVQQHDAQPLQQEM